MDTDPWDEAAHGWDTDPMVRAYAEAAYASLVGVTELSPAHRVLDFGCGTGLLTERLAAHVAEVVAVDRSPVMIQHLSAKQLPNVRAVAGQDLAALEPLSFDLIVCSSVCAFLDDYPGTVRSLVQALAPGGRFVQWDWELDPASDEPHGLSRGAIRRALAGAGLDGVTVETAFDIPAGEHRMRPLMGTGVRA